MQRIAPLAPLLLVAALAASFVAPAAAAAARPGAAAHAGARPEAGQRRAAKHGVDPTGRWIVLLRGGASVDGATSRARGMGVAIDRTFRHVVNGYAAKLTPDQVASLRTDPNVEALVPDEVVYARGAVHATRRPPRVRAEEPDRADRRHRPAGRRGRRDRGHGHRQGPPGPQRRRRRQLLHLQPIRVGRRQRARDARRGHRRGDRQRHRRGRRRARRAAVGRADPQLERRGPRLVVRVRPRLDHRAARPRRPQPPAHRVREHVGREARLGRPQLRAHQPRPDPPGDLPAGRIRRHGRRGRRQQQLQRVAAGPGQLQRGDHGLGARRQRRPPRRPRRRGLLLVGQLRQGRHVRELLELRPGRRPHRPRQVHLVDGARRVRLPVGDVDGRAPRRRRGRAVQGLAPDGDAAPGAARARGVRQPRLEAVERPGSVPRAAARRVAHRPARRLRDRGPIAIDRDRPQGRHAQDPRRGDPRRGRARRDRPVGPTPTRRSGRRSRTGSCRGSPTRRRSSRSRSRPAPRAGRTSST